MEPLTPKLHDACRTGAIEDICRWLDESPSLLNRPDLTNGCALLHHAAYGGQEDIVGELLRRGANIDARDRSGLTPLHYAAFVGASEIARRLICEGADPSAVNDSLTTVLHLAAAGGALDLVQELLGRGFPPDVRNLYGETPLHRAAQRDRLDVVRRLVERGASTNPTDRYLLTPVHKAAIGGSTSVLEWLAGRGAPLDVRDLLGDTPLHAAGGTGRTEVVRWLLKHGADAAARNAEAATPLHAAAGRGAGGVVALLLSHGADPNATDALGRSPLHVAAERGATDAIEPLVAGGAHVDAEDAERRTPLDAAATYGRWELHQALADLGASGRIKPTSVRDLVGRSSDADELAIWYLGNSGWAIRTAGQLLVIDYAPNGDDGEEASLLNGRIVADERPDLPVTVLVTHHHADHFSPRILDWTDVRYVFGWDAPVEATGHRFAGPGRATIGDVRVTAIPSTDAGAAFLIEIGRFRIYHAGDHAASEIPPEAAFVDGVIDLGERFAPVDIAFLPVFGCGLPDVEPLRAGNDLTIDNLAPRAVVPMHVGWTGHFYREEQRRLRSFDPERQVVAVAQPGDRFLYRAGCVHTLAP